MSAKAKRALYTLLMPSLRMRGAAFDRADPWLRRQIDMMPLTRVQWLVVARLIIARWVNTGGVV